MKVYDTGFYINSTLSQNEKPEIINNPLESNINYKFPINIYMKKKAVKFKVSIFVASKVSMITLFQKKKWGASCKFWFAFVNSGVGYNSKNLEGKYIISVFILARCFSISFP